MSKLVYSAYHKILKNVFAKSLSDMDLAELLFCAVIFPVELENKIGNPLEIDKQTASRLVNRTINIPKKLKENASNEIVVGDVYKYFSCEVLPKFGKNMESVPLQQLKSLIESDDNITDEIKNQLLSKARIETLNEFLADVFLYTLKVNNKAEKTYDKKDTENSDRQKSLISDPVPEKADKKELPYIKAIFEAYGDKEKIDNFSEKNFIEYPKHKENFARQRKSYYAAETLRRCARDTFADNEEPFEELKRETYDGVVDTWDRDFPNGFERMSSVLEQASQITVDSTLLKRETAWVNNNTKKGLCHVLVNEGDLEGWVKK